MLSDPWDTKEPLVTITKQNTRYVVLCYHVIDGRRHYITGEYRSSHLEFARNVAVAWAVELGATLVNKVEALDGAEDQSSASGTVSKTETTVPQ